MAVAHASSSSQQPLQDLVFFSYGADHRDLHSFPTRRSSDLLYGCTVPASMSKPWRWSSFSSARPYTCRCRSEEHTSELQSQFHLVCRLLLEKKKTSLPDGAIIPSG